MFLVLRPEVFRRMVETCENPRPPTQAPRDLMALKDTVEPSSSRAAQSLRTTRRREG